MGTHNGDELVDPRDIDALLGEMHR
ncbi:MAG: hypothetical protein QOI64_1844, partial [Solirubrobacteraceae bacterium]|nr:hypothetical protein [Solirubrobacteraceae bacterium]